MDYSYIAYDNNNKVVNGSIAAVSETAASDRLIKLGLKIVTLKPVNKLNVDLSHYLKSGNKIKVETIGYFRPPGVHAACAPA